MLAADLKWESWAWARVIMLKEEALQKNQSILCLLEILGYQVEMQAF